MKAKTTKKRLLILISIGIAVILFWSGICQLYFSGRVTFQTIQYNSREILRRAVFKVINSDLYWGMMNIKKPRTAEEHFKYASRIFINLTKCIAISPQRETWKTKLREIDKDVSGTGWPSIAQIKNNKKWQERFDIAVGSYREVIDTQPESKWADDAQFWIPVLYWMRGDYDNQIEELRKYIEKYPQKTSEDLEDWTIHHLMFDIPPPTKFTLAQLCELKIADVYRDGKKNYHRAIEEYNKIIDKYPQDSGLALRCANVIRMFCCPPLNDYQPAIDAYQKILRMYPEAKWRDTVEKRMAELKVKQKAIKKSKSQQK